MQVKTKQTKREGKKTVHGFWRDNITYYTEDTIRWEILIKCDIAYWSSQHRTTYLGLSILPAFIRPGSEIVVDKNCQRCSNFLYL